MVAESPASTSAEADHRLPEPSSDLLTLQNLPSFLLLTLFVVELIFIDERLQQAKYITDQGTQRLRTDSNR